MHTHACISPQRPLSELGWDWGVRIWDTPETAKLNLILTHSFCGNHCWKEQDHCKSLNSRFWVKTVSVSTFVAATYSNSCDFHVNTQCILREEVLGGVSLCAQASILAHFSFAGWEKLSGQTPPTDGCWGPSPGEAWLLERSVYCWQT